MSKRKPPKTIRQLLHERLKFSGYYYKYPHINKEVLLDEAYGYFCTYPDKNISFNERCMYALSKVTLNHMNNK